MSQEQLRQGVGHGGKGLKVSLLERILCGNKLRVVIAHRDRLAKFGSEVIQFFVEQNGGEVVVLNDQTHSFPEEELTQDLLSIRHVFSCRMYGLRRNRDTKQADTDLSNTGTEGNPE